MTKANQKLIDRFNDRYPVGATFEWRSIGKDGIPFERLTVRAAAYDHFGMAVVFSKERSGFISIEKNFVNYAFRPTQAVTA